MKELWKDVPGYEGRYEVSNLGNVRGTYKNKQVILKPETKIGSDYQRVLFCVKGVRKHYSVHTLVLLAFVGPCPEGFECMHLDHNPRNNCLDNLRWGSKSENSKNRPRWKPPTVTITAEDAFHMRFLRNFGASARELAKEFGVTHGHVYKILRGACW